MKLSNILSALVFLLVYPIDDGALARVTTTTVHHRTISITTHHIHPTPRVIHHVPNGRYRHHNQHGHRGHITHHGRNHHRPTPPPRGHPRGPRHTTSSRRRTTSNNHPPGTNRHPTPTPDPHPSSTSEGPHGGPSTHRTSSSTTGRPRTTPRTTTSTRPRTTPRATTSTRPRPEQGHGTPIGFHHDTAPYIPTVTTTSSDPSSSDAVGVAAQEDPSVTSTPSPSTSPAATQDQMAQQSIVPGLSNGNLALAIGLSVGGVAAIGLVGYAVTRNREKKDDDDGGGNDGRVSTRWRHQSFLAKVESLVARLPSDGRSSRSSRGTRRSRGSDGVSPVPPSPAMDSHISFPSSVATSQANTSNYANDPYLSFAPSAYTTQSNFTRPPSSSFNLDQMEDVRLR